MTGAADEEDDAHAALIRPDEMLLDARMAETLRIARGGDERADDKAPGVIAGERQVAARRILKEFVGAIDQRKQHLEKFVELRERGGMPEAEARDVWEKAVYPQLGSPIAWGFALYISDVFRLILSIEIETETEAEKAPENEEERLRREAAEKNRKAERAQKRREVAVLLGLNRSRGGTIPASGRKLAAAVALAEAKGHPKEKAIDRVCEATNRDRTTIQRARDDDRHAWFRVVLAAIRSGELSDEDKREWLEVLEEAAGDLAATKK